MVSLKHTIVDAFSRHLRIALHFSGGKDSLATLYMLRGFWERLTVYWVDTGDSVPEVREIVDKVRQEVPHFVTVHGNAPKFIEENGMPSDLVPVSSMMGERIAGSGCAAIQDRFSCCYANLMEPMRQQMQKDGVTLIIRGQKNADTLKAPIRSGDVVECVEYLFPIEGLSDEDVIAWLEHNALLPDYYRQLKASPDCLHCSAYWNEGRAKWLKEKHPAAFIIHQQRREIIRQAIMPHIDQFNQEADHV